MNRDLNAKVLEALIEAVRLEMKHGVSVFPLPEWALNACIRTVPPDTKKRS